MNNYHSNHNTALPVGFTINGRYIISKVMGTGGFSITYLATHVDMNKQVAIKEFFCSDYMYRDIRISNHIQLLQETDQELLTRDLRNFLNEARILADLSNISCIAHVTDYFHDNGTAYIVMDYIKGTTLAEQLNNGVIFTWTEIIQKTIPIMNALSQIHEKGMIHRDIKPSNIMISENGDYVLLDFGAALHYVGEETHSVYLSEGYAPKEQYLRKETLGPYTDIYALCALIYHCITGQIPEHSIQRAVFDELRRPSAIGISIPQGIEEVLMKGLQIEPEMRWQNMDDLYQAFMSHFPKPSPPRKLPFILGGALCVFAAALVAIFIIKYPELRIMHLEKSGRTISLILDAPDTMTANDFEHAVRSVKERANTFAQKNNYLLETKANRIKLTIPKDCITDISEEWDLETQLRYCFSFSGNWDIPNKDRTNVAHISSKDIKSINLEYGGFPITTSSGEEYLYDGEETDWSKKEIYYIKMVFVEETASFLSDYLKIKGYSFPAKASAIFNLNTSLFIDEWISGGDGKTAYYPIVNSNGKNIAETIFQGMTSQAYSEDLELTLKEKDVTIWSVPDKTSDYQCSVNDFNTSTIEVIYDVNNGKDVKKAMNHCMNQLNLLKIPFAIGSDQKKIHIRMPSDNVTELILLSLCGSELHFSTNYNNIIDVAIVNAEPYVSADTPSIRITVSNDDYSDKITDYKKTGDIYLYMEGTRIGKLVSYDEESAECIVQLMIDNSLSLTKYDYLKYICNTATFSDLSYYTDEKIWRDENGDLMRKGDIPTLPTGIDTNRFDSLYSNVHELGGNINFVINDSGNEELDITFPQWSGKFPEEALGMIENIYKENHFSENICNDVSIKLKTWYKGTPASVNVFFCTEVASNSVICSNGSVLCNDETILQIASDYVSNSNILTPDDNRPLDDEGINLFSGWDYRKADWLSTH